MKHKIIALIATVGMLTGTPFASGQPVAAAGSASSSGSVVATGTLTDTSGKPTSGLVVALAWPGEDYLKTLKVGDRIETPVVGSTSAGHAGSFALRVDANRIPPTHHRKDGGTNIVLVGSNATNEGYVFTSIASPAQLGAASKSAKDGASSSAIPDISLPLSLNASRSVIGSKGLGSLVPNAAPPPGWHCTSWILLSNSLVWETVGQSYSGPATNYAVIESSNSVTSGTAMSLSGTIGSWSASGSQTHTSGNTKIWTESLQDRNFQIEIKYGTWRETCQAGILRYAFTPSYGTGGDRTLAATQVPPLNVCTTTAAGLWSRSSSDGDSYSNSIGVNASTAIGLNLSVSHNYGTASSKAFTLHYRAPRTLRICGDTDYPAVASKPRIPSQ